MMSATDHADPVLAELDERIRRSVEGELRLVARRAPCLTSEAAEELYRTLARIGDRLLLAPARSYVDRFPERSELIGTLFELDRDHR